MDIRKLFHAPAPHPRCNRRSLNPAGRHDVENALGHCPLSCSRCWRMPVTWTEKGDNKSAVIFVNVVDGDHFRQIDQISD